MANCSSCSAPLQDGSILCAYCGCRNDVDLKDVHYNTTHENESERTCPRCSISLKTIDLNCNGRFLIERCDECLGLFFDPNELETLLEATVSNVFSINRSQLDSISTAQKSGDYPVSYIKCPVCGKLMNRINFGAKSGVIVDRCKEHGVWLDGGEFRHLCEWMKAGGKLLEQERNDQLKQMAEREKEREIRKELGQAPNGTYPSDSGFDLFGGPLRHSDPDLFDIVTQAIRFFTK